jgi:hypothetical protein
MSLPKQDLLKEPRSEMGRNATASLAKRIATQRKADAASPRRYDVVQIWLSYPHYAGPLRRSRDPGKSADKTSAMAMRLDQLEIELRSLRGRIDEAEAGRVAADLEAIVRPATAIGDVSTFIMGTEHPARSNITRRRVGRAAHRFVLRALAAAIFLSTTLLPWTFA